MYTNDERAAIIEARQMVLDVNREIKLVHDPQQEEP
jgi:hypothetical protein